MKSNDFYAERLVLKDNFQKRVNTSYGSIRKAHERGKSDKVAS